MKMNELKNWNRATERLNKWVKTIGETDLVTAILSEDKGREGQIKNQVFAILGCTSAGYIGDKVLKYKTEHNIAKVEGDNLIELAEILLKGQLTAEELEAEKARKEAELKAAQIASITAILDAKLPESVESLALKAFKAEIIAEVRNARNA